MAHFSQSNRIRRWSVLTALAFVAINGISCTEPVDCAAEPHRCVAFQSRAAAPSAAAEPVAPKAALTPPPVAAQPRALPTVQARAAKPDSGQPSNDPRPPVRLDAGALAGAGRAVAAELPRAAMLPAIDRVRPNAEIVAEAAKGGDERALIVTLRAGAMAHDLEKLRPFLTERLYKTLSEALPKNADRLYRHLDKYVRAINEGFEIRVEKSDAPTTRQVVLTLKDQAELKPILAMEHGTWKVDRF